MVWRWPSMAALVSWVDRWFASLNASRNAFGILGSGL